MKNYSHYSENALRAEIQNINRLLILIDEMKKPENFTYIDVLNLHTYLESVKVELTDQLNSKKYTA